MDMKEAYDLKAFGEKLKEQGLELAEEAVKAIYVAFKAWLKESAAKSTNKIDDVVAGFIDQLDAVVLPKVDDINPADNA